jgi:hypothetical protein
MDIMKNDCKKWAKNSQKRGFLDVKTIFIAEKK